MEDKKHVFQKLVLYLTVIVNSCLVTYSRCFWTKELIVTPLYIPLYFRIFTCTIIGQLTLHGRCVQHLRIVLELEEVINLKKDFVKWLLLFACQMACQVETPLLEWRRCKPYHKSLKETWPKLSGVRGKKSVNDRSALLLLHEKSVF